MSQTCSCGRPLKFSECCEPLLNGEETADGPESLMRSRYSAFVHKNVEYLYESLDPQARGDWDKKSTAEWANNADFTGLEIIKASDEGNKGSVEFKAHFKMATEPGGPLQDHTHHEISKFRKQAGVWYFRDGRVIEDPKATK
jgi:SEC-C motif-containing protein